MPPEQSRTQVSLVPFGDQRHCGVLIPGNIKKPTGYGKKNPTGTRKPPGRLLGAMG